MFTSVGTLSMTCKIRSLTFSRVCIAVALLTVMAGPAVAAIPECTAAALHVAAPAGMVIGDIPDVGPPDMPKTAQGVVDVPENSLGDGAPEYCFVTGSVTTNPQNGKTANFAAALPARTRWNGKFMFAGCGGNCGMVFLAKPAAAVLRKGYPLFATDDGHIANGAPALRLWRFAETSWAVSSPGHRNEDAATDFFYRAVHAVVVAGKELTRKYYAAPPVHYAYYQGCSDGGREGMVELAHFPSDFDGVIAGDPYFDIGAEIVNSLVGIQVQLRSPRAALTHAQLSQIDHIVSASCDAADGVSDGLIQNPAQCAFDPRKDLPRCAADQAGEQCFTLDQINSVSAILSAVTDPAGKIVYPGYPVSDFNNGEPHTDNLALWLGFNSPPDSLRGPEPWTSDPGSQPLAWYWATQTIRYLIYADASNFNALTTPGIVFRGHGATPDDGFHAVIPASTLTRLQQTSAAGDGDVPATSAEYFRHGRKLILYHGFSDGDITPFRTTQYYRSLAKAHGGYAALQKNARLFMVPGMAHCSGGPGPNAFGQLWAPDPAGPESDILVALENWVEKGTAPQSIVATKFDHDDPKGAVLRTMPLCPFPAMARYKGTGDIHVAANWSCPADDQRLLDAGHAGRAAGSSADLN
jgi:hypothetical protein